MTPTRCAAVESGRQRCSWEKFGNVVGGSSFPMALDGWRRAHCWCVVSLSLTTLELGMLGVIRVRGKEEKDLETRAEFLLPFFILGLTEEVPAGH